MQLPSAYQALCHVQVHPVATKSGGVAIRFEHPTVAGPTPGGWMNRVDDATMRVVEAPPQETAQTNDSARALVKSYTLEEVEKHDSMESAWFVHKHKVWTCHPDTFQVAFASGRHLPGLRKLYL